MVLFWNRYKIPNRFIESHKLTKLSLLIINLTLKHQTLSDMESKVVSKLALSLDYNKLMIVSTEQMYKLT